MKTDSLPLTFISRQEFPVHVFNPIQDSFWNIILHLVSTISPFSACWSDLFSFTQFRTRSLIKHRPPLVTTFSALHRSHPKTVSYPSCGFAPTFSQNWQSTHLQTPLGAPPTAIWCGIILLPPTRSLGLRTLPCRIFSTWRSWMKCLPIGSACWRSFNPSKITAAGPVLVYKVEKLAYVLAWVSHPCSHLFHSLFMFAVSHQGLCTYFADPRVLPGVSWPCTHLIGHTGTGEDT